MPPLPAASLDAIKELVKQRTRELANRPAPEVVEPPIATTILPEAQGLVNQIKLGYSGRDRNKMYDFAVNIVNVFNRALGATVALPPLGNDDDNDEDGDFIELQPFIGIFDTDNGTPIFVFNVSGEHNFYGIDNDGEVNENYDISDESPSRFRYATDDEIDRVFRYLAQR